MKPAVSFLIFLFLFSCSGNKNGPASFSVPIEKSKKFISKFMHSKKVPGMQIAVSYKNEIVFSEGFGYANLELEIPVIEQTKFKIASVSKPVAAVLTARLYQNKIVDIDAPIDAKLPEFRNKEWNFTLRQLFCHAAGIRHYLPCDTANTAFHDDIQNGLNIIKDDSLLYKPGYKFSYSSYGYNIAGAYIEKVTEKTFEDLLTDSLFIPLKMRSSIADNPYRIISNRGCGYEMNEEGDITNAHFLDNRYKIPSGGMLSTAEDLVRLGNELLYGDYLDEKSKMLLFTPFKYEGEEESDTGFGWVVTKDEAGNKLYGHLGGITGGCSVILIYPEKEIVVAFLGNRDLNWSPDPAMKIANYFFDEI